MGTSKPQHRSVALTAIRRASLQDPDLLAPRKSRPTGTRAANKEPTFDDLVGRVLPFYGVDNLCMRLGKTVWEVTEDPDDGYRSFLGPVLCRTDTTDLIFHNKPLARVHIERVSEFAYEGYQLRDNQDGHVWLRFGTADCDDYYPYCSFEYHPRSR